MWNNTRYSKPEEYLVVKTKIDDENGIRAEADLIYYRGRWWHKEMDMYVHYTPTHWMYK